MYTLLAAEAAIALVIVLGPALDDANRLAGVAGAAVSMVLTACIGLAGRARPLIVGTLALLLTIGCAVSLRYADARALRPPVAEFGSTFMTKTVGAALVHPHVLGLAVGPAAVILISLALGRGPRWRTRAVWLVGSVVGVGIVVLSDSRVAAIALGTGLAAAAATGLLQHRRAGIAASAAVTASAITLAAALQAGDPSLVVRERLWTLALGRLDGHVLLGLGYGRLAEIYGQEVPTAGNNAHNALIQTWADLGAIGVGLLVIALGWSVASALSDRELKTQLFRGFVGALAFLVVAGSAESVIDATQKVPSGVLTVLSPLSFAVLAIPVKRSLRRPQRRRVLGGHALDESVPNGVDRGLRPVRDPELFQDRRDVALDRFG